MSTDATILVADDQTELLLGIQLALEAAGYRVLIAQDGHLALELLYREPVDLILADIAMPEMNGYQLYEKVRADPRLVQVPFVFLTARAMASDIRYGKALGADDYLTKPVKPEDLLAAVEGRLRRARELARVAPVQAIQPPAVPEPSSGGEILVAGSLRVAPDQHRVWIGDQEIRIPAREFKVLAYLARHSGNVVTPSDLVRVSHGIETDAVEASALLRPLIRMLRRRLGYEAGEMGCIENVRGVGYRLNPLE